MSSTPEHRIAVVIPALNEEGNIGAVVAGLQAQPIHDVIVVNNGSTDRTALLAAEAGATVVDEPRQGYGWACAAGSRQAIDDGATIVAYIDGDQSSLPSEISRLTDPVASGVADLVLGSRTMGDIAAGAMGVHQRFGNWLTAAIMSQLYTLTVTDLGPYRAIRTDLLQDLDMSEMTFGWPTEMMVKSARRKATILEVPVTWRNRGAGKSKVSGTIKGTVLSGWFLLSVTVKHAFRTTPPSLGR